MIITSKDLYLNQEILPDKTSEEYLSFWTTEKNKCIYGIKIDGTWISGFLYFYLNFWKIHIDLSGTKQRAESLPHLRDNEWLIDSYIQKGVKEGKGVAMVGSRRLGKSEIESAWIGYNATFFKGTENVIASTTDDDIGILRKRIDFGLNNLPGAFKKTRMKDDWRKEIILGAKDDRGTRFPYSHIFIRNLAAGNNTEALAGLTPSSLVIDEIGKRSFLSALSAAIPSFATPDGWRCAPLLFGTGGSFEDGRDAEILFDAPDAYNFICVEIPDEHNKKTAFFLSGHYAHDFKKDDTKLSTYLGLDEDKHKNLSKINIQATNFERAAEAIAKERIQAAKSPDPKALLKITMYHPITRSEVFLTESNNNFPVPQLEKHQVYLKENYKPTYVDLYRASDGSIQFNISEKLPVMEYPARANTIKDAPVCMYEPPIASLNSWEYVVGIDSYSQDDSSANEPSLGTIYVLKRMYDPSAPFQNSIVASYAGRPKTLREFHEIAIMMTEFYNAIALPESEGSIIQHFQMAKKDYLLFDSPALTRYIAPTAGTANRAKGLAPTADNQKFYMNLEVSYTLLEIPEVINGVASTKLGLVRIPDVMLCEEMIKYRGGKKGTRTVHDINCDRIVAFGNALTLAHFLDKDYPIIGQRQDKEEKRQPRIISPFNISEKGEFPRIQTPFWAMRKGKNFR